jgi:predicted lipoprotein with Yx(FWY)xxD motif
MRAHLIAPSALVLAGVLAAAGCSSSKSGGNHPAGNSSTPGTSSTVAISLKNDHLVGPDGKTLYYNTVDTATNIQCTGQCASIWPPVLGTAKPGTGLDAEDFKTATRPDGGTQITFYGHPLYEFASDDTAGSTKGAGVADGGGHWLVAPKEPPATGGASSSESMSEHSSSSSSYGY